MNRLSKEILETDTAVGRRVRDLRMAANKPKADVAAHSQMSLADYAMSERGERRFRAIELFGIAKCLDVRMKDIMSGI
ncbi:hypothetical protein HYPDE_41153 [Hyphomicrobium denitrificans 1NES1]|uniref:HTH cro/C1-type domain-containing protein n=1 Tax=Hyphomicrobium denitrificans 1NES1 TaxID=670307 RepID=N0B8F2_9HYPH|nr:hypothetical protein [Hyphomicrobium denitrificans]AGK59899.1 hypothetical protein HYPDE_41153 [Hyphomicrobium denitrificans 1NES1]